MAFIVPDAQELEVAQNRLNNDIAMKLYSNDYSPSASSTVAAFVEVVGGGYAQKLLTYANWSFTSGDPTQANYNATQIWTFTGPPNAPGTIYGWYAIRVSDNKLMWAERFPSGVLPFNPVAGSTVRILPRYSVQSLF